MRTPRHIAAIALIAMHILFVSVNAASAQQHGELRRYFGDWLAACRDDGYCSATAYVNPNPGDGTVADYVMRIGRHAEEPYWEISFSTVATMADEWQELTVSVDGSPQHFAPRSGWGAYASINDFFLLGDGAQAVFDRLIPGSEVTFAFIDQGGTPHTARFSLTGLTAALLFIDEQQTRIGSERVASVPPEGLAPVGSEQTASPQVPQDLLDRHRGDPECRPLEEIANGRDFVTADLGDGATLYILPCDSYAYNFASRAYVHDGYEYRMLAFPRFTPSMGWTATTLMFLAGYDEATRELNSWFKYRGIGDCGENGTWRWTGFDFELVEFRARECEDSSLGDDDQIDEFPIVFKAPAR